MLFILGVFVSLFTHLILFRTDKIVSICLCNLYYECLTLDMVNMIQFLRNYPSLIFKNNNKMRGSSGAGGPDPLEKHKAIGFHSKKIPKKTLSELHPLLQKFQPKNSKNGN